MDAKLPPNRSVDALDCGIGSASLSLALHGLRPQDVAYHGIDISEPMLSQSALSMGRAGLSPLLRVGDVRSIPFPDASFDLVMAAHVLEHLPDPREALSEMWRVLRPGGHLFVCITRPSFFGTLIQLRWRTWSVTERQGLGWLRDCHFTQAGSAPLRLSGGAGKASLAFWGRKGR